jgi:hypothetical protein
MSGTQKLLFDENFEKLVFTLKTSKNKVLKIKFLEFKRNRILRFLSHGFRKISNLKFIDENI